MDVFSHIASIGEEVVKFLVFGVGIGYIGRKIVADYMIKEGRKFLIKTERDSAIVAHYMKQAKGAGHETASPVDCGQEKCQVFGNRAQLV